MIRIMFFAFRNVHVIVYTLNINYSIYFIYYSTLLCFELHSRIAKSSDSTDFDIWIHPKKAECIFLYCTDVFYNITASNLSLPHWFTGLWIQTSNKCFLVLSEVSVNRNNLTWILSVHLIMKHTKLCSFYVPVISFVFFHSFIIQLQYDLLEISDIR